MSPRTSSTCVGAAVPIPTLPFGVAPYNTIEEVPKPPVRDTEKEGYIELKMEYCEGLKDLDGFSHAILLFYFHQSKETHLYGKPSFEKETHGIFATRSPHRPNHIGMTIIKINRIENNKIFFNNIDMINSTPVIDIKPYIRDIDIKENVNCGWLEKHIENRSYSK